MNKNENVLHTTLRRQEGPICLCQGLSLLPSSALLSRPPYLRIKEREKSASGAGVPKQAQRS